MSQKSNRPVDWETLVTQNENRLYRAALAILGDHQEAEDAVQDAFVRFLERRPENLENPSAWLTRVLVNGCKSRLRLAWRRVGPLPDTLATPGPEEREELEELFSLPPEDRAVIHLHYYEGWSTDEIAQMLGQRPGSVRSRLSRAREKLRKLLEQELQGGLS
jgi:RNA polymerase sigma-70 factor (ECF subfamily)